MLARKVRIDVDTGGADAADRGSAASHHPALASKRAMPFSLAATAGVSIAIWRVPVRHVAAAGIKGAVVATSILWIAFGAILLLKTLTRSGELTRIRASFTAVSPDPRLQIVLGRSHF